jgi:quercetin dioxygenase-like cupin family protein
MKKALQRGCMAAVLAAGMLALGACTCNQPPARQQAAAKEELTFPIGRQLASPPFTGQAFRCDMIAAGSAMEFPQSNNITFAPGAHSGWHRHGGMVVLVTGGAGIYQEEGKPAQLIRKGDVVQIPAGVRHWHGAAKDSWFSQVVIYDSAWKPDKKYQDADNAVTDGYYDSLAPVEYAQRNGSTGTMFKAGEKELSLPAFNGPIRLSDVITEDNAAGAPSIHNVVFEPGVINAWHEHEAGQVLIVTDGVGYHQMAGRPVEILHAGEVAVCPPGVRHWHGAAPNSRFAHLAANGKRGKQGVKWYDMLTSAEYRSLPRP